jgi:hypothetical protein
MGTAGWFSENWFSVLSSLTGLGGLWFAGFAIHRDAQARREETKARRYSNQIAITGNHRELWKIFLLDPKLGRVIDPDADVKAMPVTAAEEIFVNMLISHTGSTHEALRDDLLTTQEGFRRDVGASFSLPVIKAVWDKSKLLQNQDFAAFVDSSLVEEGKH